MERNRASYPRTGLMRLGVPVVRMKAPRAVIGFDLDGTIAFPMPARPEDYDTPSASPETWLAVVGAVAWLRSLSERCRVIVVTGRPADQRADVEWWLGMLGVSDVQVFARPPGVSLDCASQTAWKAHVLRTEGASVFVGDNRRIDLRAALRVGIAYVPASMLVARDQSALERVLSYTIGPSLRCRSEPNAPRG